MYLFIFLGDGALVEAVVRVKWLICVFNVDLYISCPLWLFLNFFDCLDRRDLYWGVCSHLFPRSFLFSVAFVGALLLRRFEVLFFKVWVDGAEVRRTRSFEAVSLLALLELIANRLR